MTVLLIAGDAESVEEFDAVLRALGVSAQRSPRRNLDGAAVTAWVLAASVGLRMAPAILIAVRDLLNRKRVQELTFGDVKITNPSPDDVAKLIETLRERPPGD